VKTMKSIVETPQHLRASSLDSVTNGETSFPLPCLFSSTWTSEPPWPLLSIVTAADRRARPRLKYTCTRSSRLPFSLQDAIDDLD
jgi:hypothetical protein